MDGYWTLYRKAFEYYDNSQFADASKAFRQAGTMPGITEWQRLKALSWMAASDYINGRYAEAAAQLDETFAVASTDERYYEIACFCLQYQVHTLLANADIEGSRAKYLQVLEVVEKSLAWLDDVNKRELRHIILINKARIESELGHDARALDIAEKAYAEKKRYGGGFYEGYYIKTVAKYARILGHHERALQVMHEVREYRTDPHTWIQVLTERIRVYLAMNPAKLSEAHAAAMKIRDMSHHIQSPLTMLEANGEMARVFIREGFYPDALAAITEVRDIAVRDANYHQRLLLRRVEEYLKKIIIMLASESGDCDAINFLEMVMGFLDEVDGILEKVKIR